MKKILGFLGALACLICSPAWAVVDSNRTVSTVGVQASSGYVGFTVPPSGGCTYNLIYFPVNTDPGRALYALLLTAYASGKIVTRIDYTVSSGACTAVMIEF